MSNPVLSEAQVQLCLNAYNAGNTELQRLLAIAISELHKEYKIDQDPAKKLSVSLTKLEKSLAKIKSTASQIQWVLDAITDVLRIIAPFLL
ncbi:hypothetical protein TSO221_24255 [Azospirillum sp. TSO22-1]|nr:hypothetical protein TSO221_24255 [Azospirillum sp. TSO22-1]